MIKVNFVGEIAVWGAGGPGYADYPNTSPQVIHALLDELVNHVGVDQSDITVGETLSSFPETYYSLLAPDFPRVNYLPTCFTEAAYLVNLAGFSAR